MNEKRFFNLTSHKLTEEQERDAIKKYGIDRFVYMPDELSSLWRAIPAEADLPGVIEYVAPIRQWVLDNSSSGDIAMIMGEMTATFHLVRALQAMGIVTVAACSERKSIDKVDTDGQIRKVSYFSHVRYREYSSVFEPVVAQDSAFNRVMRSATNG